MTNPKNTINDDPVSMERVKQLKEDGYIILRKVLSKAEISKINKDIDDIECFTPDCVEYKDEIISKTLTRFELECIPAVSPVATKAILASSIPRLASNYFNEEARVGEFSVRRSILTSIDNPFSKNSNYSDGNILQTHVDYVDGMALYAFTLLSKPGESHGPTFLFSKTHLLSKHVKDRFYSDTYIDRRKETTFINFEDYVHARSAGSKLVVLDNLLPGDSLIFDLRIWHGRMPACKPGRTIMLTKFFPQSVQDESNDLLIRSSTLDLLNAKEREILIGDSLCSANRKRVYSTYYGSRTTNKYADNIIKNINHIFRMLGGLKQKLKILTYRKKVRGQYPKLNKLFKR